MNTSAGILGKIWASLNEKTIGEEAYWHIALQNESIFRDLVPIIRQYAVGKTLDLGAGKLAWKFLLPQEYYCTDYVRENPSLNAICDITSPLPFSASCFDTIFSCSVLEHAKLPWNSLEEMFRILKPGGITILSIPFIFYLHGQPHDYWRFTRHGAEYLAKKAGFRIVETVENGGLFHLILNAPSILLSCFWAMLRMNFLIPTTTRFFLGMAVFFDKIFQTRELFATNIILVLRKAEVE